MEAIMPALVHLIPYELHCGVWSVHRVQGGPLLFSLFFLVAFM